MNATLCTHARDAAARTLMSAKASDRATTKKTTMNTTTATRSLLSVPSALVRDADRLSR